MTGHARPSHFHEVWIVIRQYGEEGEEPEAAFFSRRELEAWVETAGGWQYRYACAVHIPKLVLHA